MSTRPKRTPPSLPTHYPFPQLGYFASGPRPGEIGVCYVKQTEPHWGDTQPAHAQLASASFVRQTSVSTDGAGVGKHRRYLTAEDYAFVAETAGTTLAKLGYPLDR